MLKERHIKEVLCLLDHYCPASISKMGRDISVSCRTLKGGLGVDGKGCFC